MTELKPVPSTVRFAVVDAPFSVASTVESASVLVCDVVTSNVATVSPAATVTLAGTPAAALLDARAIVRPPTGAGSEMVKVAIAISPPETLVGLMANVAIPGAVTVRLLVLSTPFADAVIVDVTSLATATVVAWNVADVCPAAIVTDAGIVTLSLDDESVTS